jgi:ABC-type oligopeptide transport system substrate-binding subunit
MCKMTRGTVAILGSFVFVAAFSLSAYAQAPASKAPAPGAQAPAAAPAQAQKPESAKGELKSVDAQKMTLTLANGQTFQYNSSTKVTGAQGGVAGLASMSGREVTIDFETKGADRIATMITVEAEKK